VTEQVPSGETQEGTTGTSGVTDTATSETAAPRMTEYASGSTEPTQEGQGSGFQKPADASAPPNTADVNSEAGWSGGGPDPTGYPAPGTRTSEARAATTDPNTVHTMRGMQIGVPVVDDEGQPLVGTGMIGGGNITAEHLPPPGPANPAQLMRQWTARAMRSPHFALLGALAGRPVTDWGLFGKGSTVRGLMLGINVETLEKELFHDGHVIERDGVWANARNFPEDVVAGDNLQQVAGSR
jgi:hypothetical protein